MGRRRGCCGGRDRGALDLEQRPAVRARRRLPRQPVERRQPSVSDAGADYADNRRPVHPTVDWKTDPDWEWRTAADDSPDELFDLWEGSVARSRALLEEAMGNGGLEQLADQPERRIPFERNLKHTIGQYIAGGSCARRREQARQGTENQELGNLRRRPHPRRRPKLSDNPPSGRD